MFVNCANQSSTFSSNGGYNSARETLLIYCVLESLARRKSQISYSQLNFLPPSARARSPANKPANFCDKCQRFTTHSSGNTSRRAKLCRINSSICAPLSLQIKFDESDSIGRNESVTFSLSGSIGASLQTNNLQF
jgi:hypothetical protein